MFRDIIGHKRVLGFLEKDLKSDSLSHAYLFCGPEGVGKFTAAKEFAKNILCSKNGCGDCADCRDFEEGSHPDSLLFEGNGSVGIEEAKDIQKFLGLKPYRSKKKIVLLDGSERMTREAANSLLKTLEEPAPSSILIIIAKNKNYLLKTIVSRCRIVNFGLVPGDVLIKWSKERSENTDFAPLGRPGLLEKMEEFGSKEESSDILESIPLLFKKRDYKEKFELAKKISEAESIGLILDYFSLLFRDMFLIKEGCSERTILSEKKEVSRWAKDFDNHSLLNILATIERIKDTVSKGISTKLFLEVLTLKIEALRRPTD